MTVVWSGGSLAAVGGSINVVQTPLAGWHPRTWADLMDDYSSIWKTQPQIRKVVGFLSRSVAQLNITLYKRLSLTDRERIEDHELARALRHPLGWRPEAKLSKTLFLESLMGDRCIYDNAYWLINRQRGEDVKLVPIPPTMIEPHGLDWLSPSSYRIQTPEGGRELASEDVVHFRGYNAIDRRVGLSPIESLRQLLLEDMASDEARRQMWERGARISGVIERPADSKEWSPQARERFVQGWRAAWAGSGPEAGGTPVLEEGMTFRPATFSARDQQWIDAKRLTREEVAAAYNIPQPLIGILDRATFANVQELHKSLYQDTLPPWLTGIEEDIEQQLISQWPDLVDANAYTEFGLEAKLRGDFETTARALQAAVGGPWLSRNEARAMQNRPRMDDPGYDALITPLNVTVGGQASPIDTAPPLAARDTVTKFLERVRRTVVGRWHEVRDGRRDVRSVWQPDRWGRELVQDLEYAGLEDGSELAAQLLDRTARGVLDALAAPDPDQALAAYFADAERASENLISELTEEVAA